MTFRSFASSYLPVAPPKPMTVRRRPSGPKRRKTKSGWHIGDQFLTQYEHLYPGPLTVTCIRNWPDWDSQPKYWLYTAFGHVFDAERCTRVV